MHCFLQENSRNPKPREINRSKWLEWKFVLRPTFHAFKCCRSSSDLSTLHLKVLCYFRLSFTENHFYFYFIEEIPTKINLTMKLLFPVELQFEQHHAKFILIASRRETKQPAKHQGRQSWWQQGSHAHLSKASSLHNQSRWGPRTKKGLKYWMNIWAE